MTVYSGVEVKLLAFLITALDVCIGFTLLILYPTRYILRRLGVVRKLLLPGAGPLLSNL
jgi:hypothetical protein